MDSSRQALRSDPSGPEPPPGTAELPCYEMDELTEWQASAPMPTGRRRARLVDRDVTEALGAARDAAPPADSGGAKLPRAPAEPMTQPIGAEPPKAARAPGAPGKAPRAMRKAANGAAVASLTPQRRTRVAPGDVLCERYVVEEKVAHYGMGHVYRALDRYREAAGAREPWVALKLARSSIGSDGETASLLRQEFIKLSQLRHPNIVDVFDIARDGELEFIVMEWLNGETLAELLERITTRRIALDRAMDIIRSTARALAHAHDLGIVHGDVKPSNIFLAGARSVKLLDFGSSGSSQGGADVERHWATPAYASCDVLEGRPPQPHDDVFALAVTAYCLLGGERPFGDLDARAARDRNVEPPPLPDDALDKWAAIRHGLALDPLDRTGNARLFLQELEESVGDRAHDSLGRDARTVFYGAVAAIMLGSIVWWSVDGLGDSPRPVDITLEAAERALADGRLAAPHDENALVLYSRVLDSDPGNERALGRLEQIAGRFVARAREALLAGDVAATRAHLGVARRASPDHLGIALVEDLLGAHGRAALLAAMHAAETDLDRAETLLADAELALPGADAGLSRAREAIAARRTENRVGELLREIDQRILAEQLSVPTGDSALDLLSQARELAPDDPRLPVAADRVMTALLFQAMFAISNGELGAAENYLAMARGMDIRHLALARAEYELARARRAELARRGRN